MSDQQPVAPAAPTVKMEPQHEAVFGQPRDVTGKSAGGATRPKITDEQIEHWFKYHPSKDKQDSFDAINAAAVVLCKTIRDRCPASADATDAIRKVREARMAANAAIACDGR